MKGIEICKGTGVLERMVDIDLYYFLGGEKKFLSIYFSEVS